MLRRLLLLTFSAIFFTAALSAGYIYWNIQHAAKHVVHSEASDKSLEGYLELAALSEAMLRTITEASLTKGVAAADAQALRGKVQDQIKAIRHRITHEVVGVQSNWRNSKHRMEEEAEELAELILFENHLSQALGVLQKLIEGASPAEPLLYQGRALLIGSPTDGFRVKLARLIASEREQIQKAALIAENSMRQLRVLAIIVGVTCCLAIIVIARYLLNRIREPFEALMNESKVMAEGNLNVRIKVQRDDEFGQIAGNINAIADDRLEKRNELLAHQRKLEKIVETRTMDLHQAMARLREMDQLRRQLFADISHELRTPLTAIRGEAEIAMRRGGEPSGFYLATLQKVIDYSGHLGRQIEDLLFLSRADAGAHRMTMSTVNVHRLLESVCAQGQTLAAEHCHHGEHCVLASGDPDVAVFADYDRLHQLFSILINNAIAYSRDIIDIRLAYVVDQDKLVTITVADRGVGIAREELKTIFVRFHRGQDARLRNNDGLGLGLPIAKAIVEAHGGTIKIDSEVGVGTTVSVTLNTTWQRREIA